MKKAGSPIAVEGGPEMSYKTILTYSDGSGGTWHRLAAAIEVARQQDAHLTVLAFGFELDLPPSLDGSPPLLLPGTAEPEAEERAGAATEAIARAGIRGEAVPVLCPTVRFARELGEAAQFADLVVLGRPYGKGVADTASSALDGALFDGDAPAIVFPDAVSRLDAGTVLIAWNGSREALRAVRAAMPLLRASRQVHIAIFDPSPSEPMPGGRLATMLSRQGIRAEVLVQVPTGEAIADSIGRCARETGAGLVVMGAYGHSRFREYVVGGATRDFLTDFSVPVLLAH
jgi:nucleotide-binding universal stress UspA family protein